MNDQLIIYVVIRYVIVDCKCIQCFEAVGWTSG